MPRIPALPAQRDVLSVPLAERFNMVDLEVTMVLYEVPKDEVEMWLNVLRSISVWEVDREEITERS